MHTNQKWSLFEKWRESQAVVQVGSPGVVRKIRTRAVSVHKELRYLVDRAAQAAPVSQCNVVGARQADHFSNVPKESEHGAEKRRKDVDAATEKKEKKTRSNESPRDPAFIPILITVAQAATLLGSSQGAIRHMIFHAEAYRSDPSSKYRGFLDCIVRPPGVGRVFIHREKLIALIAAWARNGGAA